MVRHDIIGDGDPYVDPLFAPGRISPNQLSEERAPLWERLALLERLEWGIYGLGEIIRGDRFKMRLVEKVEAEVREMYSHAEPEAAEKKMLEMITYYMDHQGPIDHVFRKNHLRLKAYRRVYQEKFGDLPDA